MYNNNMNKNCDGYIENRGDEDKKEIKKKFEFAKRKENTLCSLKQVESFLCSFNKVIKSIEVYKFFRH